MFAVKIRVANVQTGILTASKEPPENRREVYSKKCSKGKFLLAAHQDA